MTTARLAPRATLPPSLLVPTKKNCTAQYLSNHETGEVLEFLSRRPVHTVFMRSNILDNGLESNLHRGAFCGYRNASGMLEGVALVGYASLYETRTEAALVALAQFTHHCQATQMVVIERQAADLFWHHFTGDGEVTPASRSREMLLESRQQPAAVEHLAATDLRLARPADLDLVMPVQAEMCFEESGINPLEQDPHGFRFRCARRIDQGRVWVWVADGRLVFKAEILAETPEAVYLEGLYVNPLDRRRGYALRCLTQMGRHLLQRTKAISLFVNETNLRAQALYARAGYKFVSYYDTMVLPPKRIVT